MTLEKNAIRWRRNTAKRAPELGSAYSGGGSQEASAALPENTETRTSSSLNLEISIPSESPLGVEEWPPWLPIE